MHRNRHVAEESKTFYEQLNLGLRVLLVWRTFLVSINIIMECSICTEYLHSSDTGATHTCGCFVRSGRRACDGAPCTGKAVS